MHFSSATVLAIIAALVPSISAMPTTSDAASPYNFQCSKYCFDDDDCIPTKDCAWKKCGPAYYCHRQNNSKVVLPAELAELQAGHVREFRHILPGRFCPQQRQQYGKS
ncbi:uncharacterized protein EDB93DRAFT_1104046 [Suillus bovinus]|uniref:uncharacterized protein n=1 Tax=Suillus bovinus TaxID=48563 RepID=UPI001B866745|nr:uncharacterized protein EDB93DRAFT_1104046 [Suillus bovinus]KAG2147773.1 hypothetical protein EDB93DRAFT_1104046 [Suillus bovinus]